MFLYFDLNMLFLLLCYALMHLNTLFDHFSSVRLGVKTFKLILFLSFSPSLDVIWSCLC